MSDALTPLHKRIEAALVSATGGNATVHSVRPLFGGAMQENYRVDVTLEAGELKGDRRFAVRTDAKKQIAASLSRRAEYEVIRAAHAAGVKTPQARWITPHLVKDGSDGYFLDWVDGEAIGRRVVRNPELETARALLPRQLGETLARIHSITPKNTQLPLPPPPEHPAHAALAQIRSMTDGLAEVHPAVEIALRWLGDHLPASTEITLVHSDFRTGNFMVTPEGLAGVLDWEFAHWGAPLEDVAWISVRDWRFNRLDKPIGGFALRAPFYEAYERASGRRVDRDEVRFWEILGNLRWAVGSVMQGERYLSGEETDIELLAIPVRAVEMEFEALRLIEKG